MYDVQDYDDPEDFYYDHADEFDDIQGCRSITGRSTVGDMAF